MRMKRFFVAALSAVMVASTAVSSYAATTYYKGEEAWERITLPLDDSVNFANIASVSFNTKNGARPAYTVSSHSITLKNLYHAGIDGIEIVTVTMEDGSQWEQRIMYDSTGAVALGMTSNGTNATPGPTGNSMLCSLDKTADTTISKMYLDDVELPRGAWSQADSAVYVSNSYLLGVVGGRLTFYMLTGQGDMLTVEHEVSAQGTISYPKITTQVVVVAEGSQSDLSLAYNQGQVPQTGQEAQYNGGIESVEVNGTALTSGDYQEKTDVFILKPSAIEKMRVGRNEVVIKYTDTRMLVGYEVRACVFVKSSSGTAPVLVPNRVSYVRNNPQPITFQLRDNGHTIVGFKVNSISDEEHFTLDEGTVTVDEEYLAQLWEGNYSIALITEEGKQFPAATINVSMGGVVTDPSAVPETFTYNKSQPKTVQLSVDMGSYQYKSLKINETDIDSEDAAYAGGVLIISQDVVKDMANGSYNINVVTTDNHVFKVATLKIVDVELEVPAYAVGSKAILGLTADYPVALDMKDYTFAQFKIDGEAVEATYDAEKKMLMVPAEVFNAIGAKEVALSVVATSGDVFELGKITPEVVTNGMEKGISVEPAKYVWDLSQGKDLVITSDKPWDSYIAYGRSMDGRYTGEGQDSGRSGGVIPYAATFELSGDFSFSFVVYDSENNIESNPFVVDIVGSWPEDPGTPGGDKVAITPVSVTYDKRDRGDVTFTCAATVKSYVITGAINGNDVLRTGTCTTPVIPEAVLQSMDNGSYTVRFVTAEDKETDSAKLIITRSGITSGTGSSSSGSWSYPGKTLPNRSNSLGTGVSNAGSTSRGPGQSATGEGTVTGTGTSTSIGTSVTYPSIDLSSLALLVTDHYGWEKTTDGRWRFKDAAGNYRVNTYLVLNSGSYVIGADGYMVTGWILNPINGQWFYADQINGDLKDGWQLVNGVYYYMATRDDQTHTWGQMYANERTPDGYNVDASGAWIQ